MRAMSACLGAGGTGVARGAAGRALGLVLRLRVAVLAHQDWIGEPESANAAAMMMERMV